MGFLIGQVAAGLPHMDGAAAGPPGCWAPRQPGPQASGWSQLFLCVTADVGVVYTDLSSAETEYDDSDNSLLAGVTEATAIHFIPEKIPDWYN